MKASELRIGNLVKLEGISRPIKVSIIDTTETSTNTKYKPIPLTEEWLIRFSFEYLRRKDGTLGVYSNGKMNLILSNSGNVYTMKNKLIPYVHTLQNYYYFTLLTGEELTIKHN